MIHPRFRHFAFVVLLIATTGAAHAAALPPAPPALEAQLLSIQQDWARANYAASGERREAEFETLAKRAEAFSKAFPDRPEPLIWEGIVLSTYAGVKGGLGALSLCKEARARLDAALRLDPTALDGSAYTSLGTLYHKVPGFPLGFGDDRKAQKMLQEALRLNPNGIDPNYFYAEYLFDEGRYAEAVTHLNRAMAAPPRPNRELADRGRQTEIQTLLAKARQKMG